MIINLDANWFLDCDATNVVLSERRIIQAKEDGEKGIKPKPENIGKERIAQHGFYGSVAGACQGYLNKGTATSMEGVMTAAQIIAAWNDAVGRIEAACRKIPQRGDTDLSKTTGVNQTLKTTGITHDMQTTGAGAPVTPFQLPQA